MTINIRAYNMLSNSVRELRNAGARAFGGKNNARNVRGYPRDNNLVINWGGRQDMPSCVNSDATIINPPNALNIWANKGEAADVVNASNELSAIYIEQTRHKNEAQAWLDDGVAVVCRHTLDGSNGRGIELIDPIIEDGVNSVRLPDAPLYSKYFKKRTEYRVHAGRLPDGTIHFICAQRKAMRPDGEYEDTRIRNAHDEGPGSWAFMAHDISDLPSAVTNAISSFLSNAYVVASGQSFAGFDIGYNQHYDLARIIELNSAPGIGPSDAAAYMEYFANLESQLGEVSRAGASLEPTVAMVSLETTRGEAIERVLSSTPPVQPTDPYGDWEVGDIIEQTPSFGADKVLDYYAGHGRASVSSGSTSSSPLSQSAVNISLEFRKELRGES